LLWKANNFTFQGNELLQRALNDCNRAIDLDSKNWLAYNNRGLIYRNLNNQEKALVDLYRSINLNGDNYFAYFNLGGLYDEMNRKPESLENYNKALQYAVNDEQIERVKEAIEEVKNE
jgi:tetratricopeptide (TPR) repeat protein